ncbi:glycosyltransferase family 2 protein [Leptobacterium sp. I13]|uniref:glycosyltransferase family 2 protein n=1 Tax=Leptobacterium meishanense TaxID=3128904 RepID=UPI0030EC9A6B
MKLSVVILNYNVKYFLEQCIRSVQAALTNIEGEIIVVDNNSNDGSCEMVRKFFPGVLLIENDTNVGFPKGNNQGVNIAKGEYICILNPDMVIAEDTFTKLLRHVTEENIGITGVKLIDGAGKFLPESKRGLPTPWVAFTKISGLYKIFPKKAGKYYASYLSEDRDGEVDILVGSFMFMKRSLFNEVSGFDEECFMYADDIDLSYRVKNKGYRNYYFPEVTAIHYKGESTQRDELFLKRFREAMRYFHKKYFKLNIIFDAFLQLGIWYFGLTKLITFRSIEKKIGIVKCYLLVKNDKTPCPRIEKALTGKVSVKNVEEIKAYKKFKKGTEIIFDGNIITNKEIIQLLQDLKNKGATFKIHPKNSEFVIGSNHKDTRGQVIVF